MHKRHIYFHSQLKHNVFVTNKSLDMIVVVASVYNYRTDGLWAVDKTKRGAVKLLRKLWRDHHGRLPMPEVKYTKGRFCDLFTEIIPG